MVGGLLRSFGLKVMVGPTEAMDVRADEGSPSSIDKTLSLGNFHSARSRVVSGFLKTEMSRPTRAGNLIDVESEGMCSLHY